MTAGNAAHVAFMGSGLVELFGLDPAASYEHAFHALKQLAQLMRSALVAKSKEAFRQVYCWQTLNCLDLWARLLGAHAGKQVCILRLFGCSLWPIMSAVQSTANGQFMAPCNATGCNAKT